jgi:hypothetical protein
MKLNLNVFAVLAMSLLSSALVPSLKASESDKKTTITISQPLAVQGMILPAGQYVLKLLDPATNLDVVCIFNGEETQLITTIIALHTQRLQATDKSEFSFYDSPAGQPTALQTWFYPGDDTGFFSGNLNKRPRLWRQQGRHGNHRPSTRPRQGLVRLVANEEFRPRQGRRLLTAPRKDEGWKVKNKSLG